MATTHIVTPKATVILKILAPIGLGLLIDKVDAAILRVAPPCRSRPTYQRSMVKSGLWGL
jgi:hypothetical protein